MALALERAEITQLSNTCAICLNQPNALERAEITQLSNVSLNVESLPSVLERAEITQLSNWEPDRSSEDML